MHLLRWERKTLVKPKGNDNGKPDKNAEKVARLLRVNRPAPTLAEQKARDKQGRRGKDGKS
jgi:hypothetical protein